VRRFRVTRAAQADIADILAWSQERFGTDARLRYEALIVAGLRDVAADCFGGTPRAELGNGVYSWHLRRSRDRAEGDVVHRPRHFMIYRVDDEVIVVGRVLHEAMELRRHLDSESSWE